MTKYVSLLAVAALALLAVLAARNGALGDAPDSGARQEDPKFGVTQTYCRFTSNTMLRSAAAKAFADLDGHFGGAVNPVQFADSCNSDWSYWVDENSEECRSRPTPTPTPTAPFPGCATLWRVTPEAPSLHSHGNGGHIGIDTSYWVWDSQAAMDAATGHELGHLWGLDHVLCSHPHASAMSGLVGPGNHITANCTGATGLMPADLNSLDPLYTITGDPEPHLVPNGTNLTAGDLYVEADHLRDQAWFIIEHKEGEGDWVTETAFLLRTAAQPWNDPNYTTLPIRQSGVTTRQDCWKAKGWHNWAASGYGSISCISRPGLAYPVDGTLTQYMRSGASWLVGHNLSSETVNIFLYDGLLANLVTGCPNVPPGDSCSGTIQGRAPGGWHSIQMVRSNNEAWAWAVSVASAGQGQPPPLPTPAPTATPTPCPLQVCPVGGIAGAPDVALPSGGGASVAIVAAAAALLALTGAAWWARRASST